MASIDLLVGSDINSYHPTPAYLPMSGVSGWPQLTSLTHEISEGWPQLTSLRDSYLNPTTQPPAFPSPCGPPKQAWNSLKNPPNPKPPNPLRRSATRDNQAVLSVLHAQATSLLPQGRREGAYNQLRLTKLPADKFITSGLKIMPQNHTNKVTQQPR